MADKPIKKIAAHGVSVSVWENKGTNDTVFYTAKLQRSYKDGEEWKNTDSLHIGDIPAAIAVLQSAYNAIVVKELS